MIVESNSLIELLQPDLFLMVLDARQADFKDSARRVLDRADAFLLRAPLPQRVWPGIARDLIVSKPCFLRVEEMISFFAEGITHEHHATRLHQSRCAQ